MVRKLNDFLTNTMYENVYITFVLMFILYNTFHFTLKFSHLHIRDKYMCTHMYFNLH